MTLALLQLGLPLLLIAANAFLPSGSRLGLVLRSAALLALLYYVALTGLWLFPPWWTPYALMVLLLLGALFRWRRTTDGRRGLLRWSELLISIAALIGASLILLPVYQARSVPSDAIDLAMPLGPGRYLVTSGGTSATINAHLIPLPP